MEPCRFKCLEEEHGFHCDKQDAEKPEYNWHYFHGAAPNIPIIPSNFNSADVCIFIEICSLFGDAFEEDSIVKALLSSAEITFQPGYVTLHLDIQCYERIVAIVILLV